MLLATIFHHDFDLFIGESALCFCNSLCSVQEQNSCVISHCSVSQIFVLCVGALTGGAACNVDVASENELQCVIESEEQTYTVTNQGFDYGRLTCLSLVQMFDQI